ncbi:hypothetical protein [Rubidibacter lacunae]|nr:hypothetical protein [Rubidibacter lacunae]
MRDNRGVFSTPIYVYQWHQEGFTVPSGATLRATGTTFPNRAFC